MDHNGRRKRETAPRAATPTLFQDANLRVDIYPGSGIREVAFNLQKDPWKSAPKELRQAVAYCLDRKAINEALYAGRSNLGYDTFWMAEHHFQPEGTECIPNLLMMAMHLVNQTRSLRIGCGFNVVPMWHPLRLAAFGTRRLRAGRRSLTRLAAIR